MQNSNRLGDFGEDTVSQLLHRRIAGAHPFSVHRLGEKAPTLDFIVNLVDARGHEYGPFFFIQVRTTGRIARAGQGICANFSAHDVALAQARRVPVYLAAVLSTDNNSEEIYVLGIDSAQTGGVRFVPRLFALSDETVRMAIYHEVHAYFDSGVKKFVSRLTRKTGRIDHDYFG